MRVQRSLPYIRALINAPVRRRKAILQSFPLFVADDIVEILYNVVNGNVSLPRRRRRLQAAEKRVVAHLVARARNRGERRRLIYKQSGGFLGAVLPLLATVVGSLIGNA